MDLKLITVVVLALFAVVTLILSAVSYNSVKDMKKDEKLTEDKLQNAQRSSMGLVVMSVFLVLLSGFFAWDQMKNQGSMTSKVLA
jgi:hypothetical protein